MLNNSFAIKENNQHDLDWRALFSLDNFFFSLPWTYDLSLVVNFLTKFFIENSAVSIIWKVSMIDILNFILNIEVDANTLLFNRTDFKLNLMSILQKPSSRF